MRSYTKNATILGRSSQRMRNTNLLIFSNHSIAFYEILWLILSRAALVNYKSFSKRLNSEIYFIQGLPVVAGYLQIWC